MKTIKFKLLILTVLLSAGSLLSAQSHTLDSLRVKVDSLTNIELSVYYYKNLETDIENDLTELKSLLQLDEFKYEQIINNRISFEPDKRLRITPLESNDVIIWKDGKAEYDFNKAVYQLEIATSHYLLKIESKNRENILSDELINTTLLATKELIKNEKRRSQTFNYEVNSKGLSLVNKSYVYGNNNDQLVIGFGLGASLIKNLPMTDIRASFEYVRTLKSQLSYRYSLTYERMFDFGADNKTDKYDFVGLGFSGNYNSDRSESPKWIGAEVGYLTYKTGNLFEKNTFRLGLSAPLGSQVNFSIYYYIGKNQSYPALRIGIGF